MRIEFRAKTNKDYCMINVATFFLKKGGTITIDRERTEYSIDKNNLTMTWDGIYLWRVNDECIFEEQNVFPSEDFIRLINTAIAVEFELEDDADEDYKVDNVSWIIS